MRSKDKLVLVVNDEHQVLRIIQAILASAGFTVLSSESVAGAMKALSEHGAPDLIITDIHIPEIDGWGFCRLPRMDEYLEFNEVPVLKISATFITDGIRRISLENGASDHPAVHFSAAELIGKVSGLIAGKPVQASFGILIVERDDEHRNSLERAFTERGCRGLAA
ncbi:MAG: response regulator [Spirochaetes bacterium]|nr:response regulator [Spirochaetota bacterium]